MWLGASRRAPRRASEVRPRVVELGGRRLGYLHPRAGDRREPELRLALLERARQLHLQLEQYRACGHAVAILGQQAADTALGDLAHDVAVLRQQLAVALQQGGVVGVQDPRRRAADEVAPEVGGRLAHFQRRIRQHCGRLRLSGVGTRLAQRALDGFDGGRQGFAPGAGARPPGAPGLTGHGRAPFEKTQSFEFGCAKICPGARIAACCCGSLRPPLTLGEIPTALTDDSNERRRSKHLHRSAR